MRSKPSYLIVGLGNPGSKYSETRHNIGWMVAAALCDKFKRPVMPLHSLAYISSVRTAGELAIVALPTTFMNRSGEAVASLMEQYELPVERIVVISDEYNFPVGKIHLRKGGGDGGHNGLIDIIENLDSADFIRLRCGIGKDFVSGEMPDYVLSVFKDKETDEKNKMISKAVDALQFLIANPIDKAMSFVNSGSLWKPKEKPSPSKTAISEESQTKTQENGEDSKL